MIIVFNFDYILGISQLFRNGVSLLAKCAHNLQVHSRMTFRFTSSQHRAAVRVIMSVCHHESF